MFNFLCRVRDLRPRWSTRRRAGFSCATLYDQKCVLVCCMYSTGYTCQILMELDFLRQIFEKYPNIKFNENPSTGCRIFLRTDRQNVTNVTVAVLSAVNAPKTSQLLLCREIIAVLTYVQICKCILSRMYNVCGNKMPTRCNRGFYCRSCCLPNMFRASLCPSSGAQEYYTVVAACGISCCGFQVAGLVWS